MHRRAFGYHFRLGGGFGLGSGHFRLGGGLGHFRLGGVGVFGRVFRRVFRRVFLWHRQGLEPGQHDRLLGGRLDVVGKAREAVAGVVALAFVLVIFLVVVA